MKLEQLVTGDSEFSGQEKQTQQTKASQHEHVWPVAKVKDILQTPWRSRIHNAANQLYSDKIKPLVCKKAAIASANGRRIPLKIEHAAPLTDQRRGHSYVSNDIRTSRYTIWNFLPKQAFFQFTRVGNFYFLCVGIPQTVRNKKRPNTKQATFSSNV